ncbi:MAG: alpha/beta hydrolase [Bacteroidota bacterium]
MKWTLKILIGIILIVLMYGSIKQWNYDSKVWDEHQPTGKFSDIGSNKIHFKYSDKGNITYVLIAGLGESMHTWSPIEDSLKQRGRVFMYDRSGLGFSEEGILPRSVDNTASELHSVLNNEAIPGPYIVIGHSAGGFIARYYAKKFPDKVAGLFLIDPYQGDIGQDEIEEPPLSYKAMNWSFRNMAWSGIPFFLLPQPPHPIYKTSKAIRTYGQEGNTEKISLEQFSKYKSDGLDMPLYLLFADQKGKPFNELNAKWSKEMFELYSNRQNQFISIESGHHIHIEKPKMVLTALDEFTSKISY